MGENDNPMQTARQLFDKLIKEHEREAETEYLEMCAALDARAREIPQGAILLSRVLMAAYALCTSAYDHANATAPPDERGATFAQTRKVFALLVYVAMSRIGYADVKEGEAYAKALN
jgi:hypothetical protein